MELKTIKIEKPEATNFILGQSHFIKTVEDIYEAIVNTVPQMKFGVAFNEASGPCLTRVDGNDDTLKALAAKNAEEMKRQLVSDDPSPMIYNSPKPAEIIEVDKIVEKWPLHLLPDDIKIVPADEVFHGTENDPTRNPRGGQPDPRAIPLHQDR